MAMKSNGAAAPAPAAIGSATNPMVSPLLTDLYQFTTAYAYWKAGKHQERAVNVAAGKLFNIPLRGTHSHAFVSSFMSPDEIVDKALKNRDGSRTCKDFVSLVQAWLSKLQSTDSLCGVFGETNQSELAAFISYALAFPNEFLALVDTYDVIRSGIPNFCAVALALNDLGL